MLRKYIMHSEKKLFVFLTISLLLGGCAANIEKFPSLITPQTVKLEAVPIGYADVKMQSKLTEAGLLPLIKDYWDTHAARNWTRLHSFEKADDPISMEFYIAYYARAWRITKIEVVKLEFDENVSRMTLSMDLKNPENGKTRTVNQPDKWVRIDGVWKHWVSDPMLTGNR